MPTERILTSAVVFFVGVLAGINLGAVTWIDAGLAFGSANAGNDTTPPARVNAAFASAAHSDGLPQLEVDKQTHDFGQQERGTIVSHTFTVRNVGASHLEINEVASSCSCTTADQQSMSIPSGKNAKLKVDFDLAGLVGSQRRSIHLFTNDPTQQHIKLMLSGEVTWKVRVQPAVVDFGRIAPDASREQAIDIYFTDGIELTPTGVATSSTHVVAQYEEVIPLQHYRLYVGLRESFPEGRLLERVDLLTDGAEEYRQIRVPVRAAVMASGAVSVTQKQTTVANLTDLVLEE